MVPLFWAMAGKARGDQCIYGGYTGRDDYSPLVSWVNSWGCIRALLHWRIRRIRRIRRGREPSCHPQLADRE